MYKTKIDTTVKFSGLDIFIAAGSTVISVKGGGGKTYFILANPSVAYTQHPYCIGTLRHDIKYRYIYVPNEIVDECKNLTA
jgi:hypothetical protein